MNYQPPNSLRRRRKPQSQLLLLAIVAVIILAGVGAFGYRWWHQRQQARLAAAQSPNPQTDLGNESKRDDSATNTDEQNKALGGSTTPTPGKGGGVTLPVPTLTKSSGNNGTSVPTGSNVDFVCAAPAGYQCRVELSGAGSVTLAAKSLVDDGRTQPAVDWIWEAKRGSWNVVAVLSDGKGNEQVSSSQTLEVK